MRGLLPPTPLGTPPGGVAALGSSDRLGARPGNVKEVLPLRTVNRLLTLTLLGQPALLSYRIYSLRAACRGNGCALLVFE
eukprot:7743048-Pyramimonas_sp.AAC.2